MSTKSKQVKVPAEVHAELSALSDRDGVQIWRVIHDAIEAYRGIYPEPREFYKRLNFAGRPAKPSISKEDEKYGII